MADVAFDAAQSAAPTTGTTRTWSHTCTGADRILFVFVHITSQNDWITSVTYNSVAMTRIVVRTDFAAITGYVYALFAPATGANNIVATSSNSVQISGASASYANAKQTTTMDIAPSSAYAGTPNATRTWGPTHPVTDRAFIALFGWNSAEVPVASTNFTNRSVVNREAFTGDRGAVTSPQADVYLVQTTSVATNWLTASVVIAPVPSGSGAVAMNSARRRRE